MGTSFVLRQHCGIWKVPGWELVTRKPEPWLEAWDFSPEYFPPLPSASLEWGEGLEMGVNTWLCLCEQASIKISLGGGGCFMLVNTSSTVAYPNSMGTEALVLRIPWNLVLCITSSGCSSVSFTKLVNVS